MAGIEQRTAGAAWRRKPTSKTKPEPTRFRASTWIMPLDHFTFPQKRKRHCVTTDPQVRLVGSGFGLAAPRNVDAHHSQEELWQHAHRWRGRGRRQISGRQRRRRGRGTAAATCSTSSSTSASASGVVCSSRETVDSTDSAQGRDRSQGGFASSAACAASDRICAATAASSIAASVVCITRGQPSSFVVFVSCKTLCGPVA